MRLVLLILGIFVVILAGFLLLGEASFFDPRRTLELLDRYSAWAAVCVASSLAVYGLCRQLGRRAAVRLAGERDLERVRGFFERWGSLTIVASRPVPMLAEAVVCLAGMSRMPLGRFLLASTVGAIPFAMGFAWLGAVGRATEEPLSMLLVSVAVPLLLWVPVAWLLARRAGSKPVDDTL